MASYEHPFKCKAKFEKKNIREILRGLTKGSIQSLECSMETDAVVVLRTGFMVAHGQSGGTQGQESLLYVCIKPEHSESCILSDG
jgi:hypothetical protein